MIGMIEMARKAIGLALHCFEHRKPDCIIDDDEKFREQSGVGWPDVLYQRNKRDTGTNRGYDTRQTVPDGVASESGTTDRRSNCFDEGMEGTCTKSNS
jgi:hypothetical protein